ncbi:MAG: site-2 protease family protein [Verrucomicrobiales bacterium]
MDFLLNALRFLGIMFMVLMVFNLMIVVHEWGHFLAARWRGLKVERFQIWFGKPLWKKTINGVQYGLGSIPFGGFVALPQMAPMEAMEGKNLTDEEAQEVLPPISPLDKIIVAFAGPLFSFGLAVLFAAIVALPWVGKVVSDGAATTEVGYVGKGSPAEQAGIKPGDKILTMDGQPVLRFHGMLDSVDWFAISSQKDTIDVVVERPGEAAPLPLVLDMSKGWAKSEEDKAAEKALPKPGWVAKVREFVFSRPPLPSPGMAGRHAPMVGKVYPHSPADEAGLQPNDILRSMDGVAILSSMQVSDYIESKGSVPIKFGIERGKKQVDVTMTPRLPDVWTFKQSDGTPIPPSVKTGIKWDEYGVTTVDHNVAVMPQIKDSLRSISNILGAMFQPKSKVKATHLSSAVGIMRLYYRLFEHPDGWRLVLWFSVILNVNLAVLNLLPLPVLDGGHITMALIEKVRGRPLTGKPVEWIQSGFAIMLFSLMIVLVLKDIGDFGGGGSGEAKFLPPAERAKMKDTPGEIVPSAPSAPPVSASAPQ